MAHSSSIKVELKLHPDAHALVDEWSGITDPVVRRKLQNRLNQRAARRRKALQTSGETPATTSEDDIDVRTAAQVNQASGLASFIALCSETPDTDDVAPNPAVRDTSSLASSSDAGSQHLCPPTTVMKLRFSQRPGELEQIGRWMMLKANPQAQYPLPADCLLSLIYYNVYRAFVTNIGILGLDYTTICLEDSVSPFLGRSPQDPALQMMPVGFRPTYLQCTIEHHPMWDVFPDPTLRDNVLCLSDSENLNEEELCLDLIGDGITEDSVDCLVDSGLIVWGEPWDINSWEVSEKFARKWSWFVKDAFLIIASTNEWRRKRGQPPIYLEA